MNLCTTCNGVLDQTAVYNLCICSRPKKTLEELLDDLTLQMESTKEMLTQIQAQSERLERIKRDLSELKGIAGFLNENK